jgi:hypothetical protein
LVVEHRLQLVGAREHRQWKRDSDQAEGHAAERRLRNARHLQSIEQRGDETDHEHEQDHDDDGQQAYPDAGHELPAFEPVGRHLVRVEEEGAADREEDPERQARGDDRPRHGPGGLPSTGSRDLHDQRDDDDGTREQNDIRGHVVEFVRTLDRIGCQAPIGVEVFSDELEAMYPSEAARRVADATRRLLAEAAQ